MKDRRVNDKAVPYIAVISPAASFLIDRYSETLLFGYRFGFEILLLNALLTFAGLLLFREKPAYEPLYNGIVGAVIIRCLFGGSLSIINLAAA